MIQGAIFDMDGLMLDTERISARGWIEAGRVMGVPIDEPFLAKFRGTNAAYSRRLCKERFGEAFDYDRAREIRTAYLHEVIDRTGVPVKKGLRELLSWLNEQSIPCAVATSTRQELAEEYLEKADLLKWFSYRIFGNLVEKSKPDPEIFLRAAEGLHRKASECAVFEDSPNGIRAGIAAGSLVIAIPDITEIPEELRRQADAVLSDLLAARDFLKEHQV